MTSPQGPSLDVSVIIPVGNRHAPDLLALCGEYHAALDALGRSYEMIVVLDGPRPEVAADVQRLLASDRGLAVISLTRSFGEATALVAGFQRARGHTIVTLPAYHQIRSSEIGKLIGALGVTDLAIGRRWPRAGGRFEGWRRELFHGLLGSVTGQRFHDLGCSARAMKRRVLEEIVLYGDQHRFLPVLAARNGFRVLEIELHQSPLDRFDGRYPPREYLRRALDIATVFFLVRFTNKPLRFFGMVGVGTFVIGALLIAYLAVDRLVFRHPLADRPALLLSSLLVVLGMQLLALGLLGELVIFTHARDIKDYQVEEVVRYPAPASANTAVTATAAAASPERGERALERGSESASDKQPHVA